MLVMSAAATPSARQETDRVLDQLKGCAVLVAIAVFAFVVYAIVSGD
ncbi:hypothetical protein [Streptomyces sp. NPDC026589]